MPKAKTYGEGETMLLDNKKVSFKNKLDINKA